MLCDFKSTNMENEIYLYFCDSVFEFFSLWPLLEPVRLLWSLSVPYMQMYTAAVAYGYSCLATAYKTWLW